MAARIVVTEFVSLDGVMEAPGGEPDFEYPGWSFEFDRGDDGNRLLQATLGMVRKRLAVAVVGMASYHPAFDADGRVPRAAIASATHRPRRVRGCSVGLGEDP